MPKVNKILVPKSDDSYEEQDKFLKIIKNLVDEDSIIILNFADCKAVSSRILGGVIYLWKTKKVRLKFEKVGKELAKDFKMILPEKVVDVFGLEDDSEK